MKNASFNQEGTFVPDGLLAGDYPIRTRSVTINDGLLHVRGELLGIVTATGLAVLSADAAADGSEAPNCILAEDVDATMGSREGVAYLAGDFNENAMSFGAGHTPASTREGLRALNIYLQTPVRA